MQQPNESADNFITALYALAENCNYGALHDKLLRDRLVVGLRDSTLSEKAINMARQSEVIKKQQTDIRGETKCRAEIDAVAAKANNKKNQNNKTEPVKIQKQQFSQARINPISDQK